MFTPCKVSTRSNRPDWNGSLVSTRAESNLARMGIRADVCVGRLSVQIGFESLKSLL
jgi:hypothetical protein